MRAPLDFDYGRFAERFRGTEEYVKAGQQFYLPYFRGQRQRARYRLRPRRVSGDDARRRRPGAAASISSEESVALCRQKGLDAEKADLFEYLENLPEASLDGIFCSQVVEHLPPERLPEMIRLARQPSGSAAA